MGWILVLMSMVTIFRVSANDFHKAYASVQEVLVFVVAIKVLYSLANLYIAYFLVH